MMRGRAVLALTADLDPAGPARLLPSLLDELAAIGAIDPAQARTLALRGPDGVPSSGRRGAGPSDRSEPGPSSDGDPPANPTGPPVAVPMTDPRSGPDGSVRVLGPGVGRAGRWAARLTPVARPVGDRLGVAWGLLRQPAPPGARPPDLVWAHDMAALALAAALPGPARRAPLVAHVPHLLRGSLQATDGTGPASLLRRAAVVVAGSTTARDDLAAFGLDPDRVVVHHGWVPGLVAAGPPPVRPVRPAGVPADALLVGTCGPLGWLAGTDLLLDLAARLPRVVDGRPVHLAWIGAPARPVDGPRTRADVVARALAGRVHLLDDEPDVAGALATLDLLVVPAREEGLAWAALEAGARGVPVAGFRAGALPEVVPGSSHTATLADHLDVAGLAQRVEALLADPRARRAHASALRAHVLAHHRAAPVVRALWADVAARLARA